MEALNAQVGNSQAMSGKTTITKTEDFLNPDGTINEERVEAIRKVAMRDNFLNTCKLCGKKAGRYGDKETQVLVGIYLLNAAGGGKICNVCVQFGKGEREVKNLSFKQERKINKKYG